MDAFEKLARVNQFADLSLGRIPPAGFQSMTLSDAIAIRSGLIGHERTFAEVSPGSADFCQRASAQHQTELDLLVFIRDTLGKETLVDVPVVLREGRVPEELVRRCIVDDNLQNADRVRAMINGYPLLEADIRASWKLPL